MNNIAVSVIVPVYNSEQYLHRCLDSLVSQTLQNIEIIAVDNGSTDNSLSILYDYKALFPEKIVIHQIEHKDYAGAGRNAGIEIAKGEYIGFCDSDDYMAIDAFEVMYSTAQKKNGVDVVFTSFYIVKDGKLTLSSNFRESPHRNEMIMFGSVSLWNKIFKTEYIRNTIKIRMSETHGFEDLGYLPILLTNAKSVAYVNHPTYYYLIRQGSEVNSIGNPRNLDIFESMREHTESSDPNYNNSLLFANVRRVLGDIDVRWFFADYMIEWLKENKEQILNNKIIMSSSLATKAKFYINYVPDESIPRRIYLNEFAGKISPEYIQTLKTTAFYPECEVVLLNEENCDIHVNPNIEQAYYDGNLKYVCDYFASERIYNEGGVFIDNDIIIDGYFNAVRYSKAFFSFEDNETFSNLVYGGCAKSTIFRKLLDTYKLDSYNKEFIPLCERARIILLAEENIKLDGHTNRYKYSASLFAPNTFLIPCAENDTKTVHISHVDYSTNKQESEIVTIPRSIYNKLAFNPVSIHPLVASRAKCIESSISPSKKNVVEYIFVKILGKRLYNYANTRMFPIGTRRREFLKKILF